MKRVKSLIAKIRKNKYTPFAILLITIIGLITYIIVDNDNASNTTTFSQVKVNNNLGDLTACKSNTIRSDSTDITIKYCGNDQVIVLDSSNVSTDTSETTEVTETETDTTITESETTDTSTCAGATVEETLNIKNVSDFYSSYNYIEDSYVYYILTTEGKVYTTTEANIINKNYEVSVIKDLESIIDIDEFVTYENNTNIYTSDVYAVDKNGELHFLRNIY